MLLVSECDGAADKGHDSFLEKPVSAENVVGDVRSSACKLLSDCSRRTVASRRSTGRLITS